MTRLLLLLLLVPGPARAADHVAFNPYTYDQGEHRARDLFYSRADLRDDPLFEHLIEKAENTTNAEVSKESRDQLVEFALPVALALGKIDTGGAAQAFFKDELDRAPVDYYGIIKRFREFRASSGMADKPRSGPPDAARRGEHIREMAGKIAASLRFQMGKAEAGAATQAWQGPRDESLETAQQYRLPDFRVEDPQGDLSLVVLTRSKPRSLPKWLARAGGIPAQYLPPEYRNPVVRSDDFGVPNEKEIDESGLSEEAKAEWHVQRANSRLNLEGRKNPIKIDAMAAMFNQILAEEAAKGLEPKAGQPQRWSREFSTTFGRDPSILPYATFPKLLLALSCGVTARFMPTGKEGALRLYLLGRDDESVQPHELIRESYRLNGGDVTLALLTIENILSEYWRSPNREKRMLTTKLAPIGNHYHESGTKFGEWYHFFGILLYAYTGEGPDARFIADTEALGNRMLAHKPKTQEAWCNTSGAEVGIRLRKIVRKQEWKKPRDERDFAEASAYLDHTEDYRDRIVLNPNKDIKVEFYNERVHFTANAAAYTGCRVEMMVDTGFGLNSEKMDVRDGVDLVPGKTASVGYRSPGEAKGVRAFFTCKDGRTAVVERKDR